MSLYVCTRTCGFGICGVYVNSFVVVDERVPMTISWFICWGSSGSWSHFWSWIAWKSSCSCCIIVRVRFHLPYGWVRVDTTNPWSEGENENIDCYVYHGDCQIRVRGSKSTGRRGGQVFITTPILGTRKQNPYKCLKLSSHPLQLLRVPIWCSPTWYMQLAFPTLIITMVKHELVLLWVPYILINKVMFFCDMNLIHSNLHG